MADATRGGISFFGMPPYLPGGTTDLAMIEILLVDQLARNPLQAMARRWYCRSLYRASRGRRQCPDCTNS
ncbi:hypothetical protein KMZ68_22295 [Bradyrhizobium sediminis]|uniref:Uncharacterized protein n=1 Tax=Bradyrhizobium sediminis TaxID=2840469 RepID=A0A975NUN1_9BRAD|nr:hypothetical protein [Bradyrhizobium sediminis]QWG21041.1 hypothetical protein KMZ68_22295 [Bradyrhizobium sediminis]